MKTTGVAGGSDHFRSESLSPLIFSSVHFYEVDFFTVTDQRFWLDGDRRKSVDRISAH